VENIPSRSPQLEHKSFFQVTVGRLSGDIICPGSTISRFHSRLVYMENTWNVVDLKVLKSYRFYFSRLLIFLNLQSINGVHVKSVNGTSRRLAPNNLTPLNAGDVIIFGSENVKSEDRFVFELCRNLQVKKINNLLIRYYLSINIYEFVHCLFVERKRF